MPPVALFLVSLPCCFALVGCVAPSTITISAVDRFGTPQPYARVGAEWPPPPRPTEERVILLQDTTDEQGRFTIRDKQLPKLVYVWSPETHQSGTLYHVKWGYNVVVLR
jgi:hypothetical protein